MFQLDQRLQSDTCYVGDLPLCRVLLMNDCRFPWLILVPRLENTSEVFTLTTAQQQTLWQESNLLAKTLNELFAADKINIATLGNVVRQLHMHVVVRKQSDAAWPGPVWGHGTAQPYQQQEIQRISTQLCAALGQDFTVHKEQP